MISYSFFGELFYQNFIIKDLLFHSIDIFYMNFMLFVVCDVIALNIVD